MDMVTLVVLACTTHDSNLLKAARLRENEDSFNRYKIRPRLLRNVSGIDTSAEIFGYKVLISWGGQSLWLMNVAGKFSMRFQSISNAQACASGW